MSKIYKKPKYIKPKIDTQKIKVNFFLSDRFFDSSEAFLVSPVFASSCGIGPASGAQSSSSWP